MGRDFYKTLGVERSASADEIKRAYRTLTKQYHPDRNPDDPAAEQRFKEVQEAYAVLGDKDKRAEFDQFGDAAVGHWETGPTGQRVYTWGGGTQIPADDLEDLFSAFGGGASVFGDIFGRGGARTTTRRQRRPRPAHGQDVERTVNLSFDQAVHGTKIEVDITQDGRNRQTLDVKIPPAVVDGQRIRIKGRGMPGQHGGSPGDLFLRCAVRPHPYFRSDGLNVTVDLPLSITEAALGAKVNVPTIAGPVEMTIPPGTASGAKLRLRGKGIQNAAGTVGDQFVVIQIVPPKSLTDDQTRLLEQLRDTLKEDPRHKTPWRGRDDGTNR
jgi:DnaJ-class molecular chaperone